MGKTINVVYCMMDYKENKRKILKAPATIRDDGTAEIHQDGNPFKRLEREQGNWFDKAAFDSEWYGTFEEYIEKKVEKRLEERLKEMQNGK